MNFSKSLFSAVLWSFVFIQTSTADVLKIGIHEKPPYAFKDSNGDWTGLSVQLWNAISSITGIQHQFIEVPYEDLIAQVSSGQLDAAVGEIEVTADAIQQVDFTQPFLNSSVCAALREQKWTETMSGAFKQFFTWKTAAYFGGILASMFLVSFLIWILERNHSHGHFIGGLTGIGSALWFSAVTMTTVGYGDKTPATLAGRVVAFFWMLFGVVLVSAFTAMVTSEMATVRITRSIQDFSDVHQLSCGALKGSPTAKILKGIGVTTHEYENLLEAFTELGESKIEAIIGDRNTLLYLTKQFAQEKPPRRFFVTTFRFRESFLAIPINQKYPYYRTINEALLKYINSDEWRLILRDWLGRNEPLKV